MLNRFQQFMSGRYGNDMLNSALCIFGCILTFVFSIFRLHELSFISYIPFAIALFRAFSKSLEKRQRENIKFLSLAEPWMKHFRKKASQWQDTNHRYYNCPGCSKTLRVPKNRGKIKISCPHCGREFTKRT